MKYTGERYLPWEPNAQAGYEHYHRYLLSLSFAKGKHVLDLASGEGYGTALLASVAIEATGIDKDPQSVTHALNQYIRGNLKFIQGSIHDVPLHNQVFDLITCFEAIEHVAEQEKVIEEALRLLSDDGLLIISTPNKLVFSGEAGRPWPWHVREFGYSEFQSLLKGKFKDVIYLGQKVVMGSAIWLLQSTQEGQHASNEIFVEKSERELRVVSAQEQTPMFFVAIASKRDLSKLRQNLKNSSLIDVSLGLLKEKNGWIEKLKKDVETLDAMVRDKDADLANINMLVQAKESDLQKNLLELSGIRESHSALQATNSALEENSSSLKNQIETLRILAQDKELELSEMRELYPALQAANSALEKDAANLRNQIEALHVFIRNKEQDIRIAAEFIAELHRSAAWRMALRIRALRDRLAPANSLRRRFLDRATGASKRIGSRPSPSQTTTSTTDSIDSTPAANKRYAICTIASKNYLGMVRTFVESVQCTNPGTPVFVLLVDRVENKFDPANEPYQLITLDELDNIPDAPHLLFKYDPIELNTAVKPFFLEYLFRKIGVEKVCYFDPDILVFTGLESLWKLMDVHSIVVTPHITAPYSDELHPNELEINMAGVFNLGFIGLANTPTSAAFLTWWKARLYNYCYMKPDMGMHVDQNWVNFAPTMHTDVFILRDSAYNIAYWNLHERGHRLYFENNVLYIDRRPATFYHFSGFDPNHIENISRHQNRFTLADFPNLRPLFSYYRNLLQKNNYVNIKKWTYAFDRFDNGISIPKLARTLYSQLSEEEARNFGNPFTTNGAHTFFDWLNRPENSSKTSASLALTRLQMEIYHARADLQEAFPDPNGADQERFVSWLIDNAGRDHNLEEIFLPSSDTLALISHIEHNISPRQLWYKLLLSLRQTLKKPVNRLLPSDSSLRHQLKKLDSAYFDLPIHKTRKTISPLKQARLPFGVNIAGYLKGEFGVAEAARTSIKALESVGVSYVLNRADTHVHRHEDPLVNEFSEANPYRVNLVHVNADQTYEFMRGKGADYFQGRYNIGYWFWELSQFPSKWYSAFNNYQEIWVASAFCQDSIARVSPIPVVKVTFPILMDNVAINQKRSAFGLPEDKFLFGFVFDYLSLAERKNPIGLIKAFQRAFEKHEDTLLVIKTINGEHAPEKVALLRDLAKNCNIKFIDGHISRQEMTNLSALFDSFVSLHRSEGFGIGMAQAMSLGKPVIATGYSGNMDFMTHNNSYLVRYQITELQQDYGSYEKGNIWAEPDLDHAAELMRLVFTDPIGAQKIAERAKADIQQQKTAHLAGEQMKARLLAISG